MGLPKTSAVAHQVVPNAFTRNANRDLRVSETDEDYIGALRGLLWASLLAAPFWLALYLLLRWWTA